MAISATVARLSIQIVANALGALTGIKGVERAISGFGGRITAILASIGTAFAGMMAVRTGFRVAADMERMQASFAGFLGSQEKAKEVLGQLRDFAAISPFTTTDIAMAAKQLLQYGESADTVVQTVRNLTDTTGGNIDQFQNMALAYGQVSSMGKLMGQELRQMINAGFNPLNEVFRMTGVEVAQLKEAMADGAISAKLVAMAFESATHGTGRFANQTADQARTLGGAWNQLVNVFERTAAQIVESLRPAFMTIMNLAAQVLRSIENMDGAMVRSVASWGVFAVTFAASAVAIGYVIRAGGALVTTLRAIAAGQAFVLGLSGPKGWGVLAAGLVIAGGAAYYVSSQFEEMAAGIGDVSEIIESARRAMGEYDEESHKAAMRAELDAGKVKAAEEARLSSLKSKAAQLREALRTPLEVFTDSLKEVREMFERGFIDENIFSRAIEKAMADFDEASKTIKNARADAGPGTSAAVKGTAEGSKAVAEAQRLAAGMAAQRAVSEKQLAAQKEANKILAAIRDKPLPAPVVLSGADL